MTQTEICLVKWYLLSFNNFQGESNPQHDPSVNKNHNCKFNIINVTLVPVGQGRPFLELLTTWSSPLDSLQQSRRSSYSRVLPWKQTSYSCQSYYMGLYCSLVTILSLYSSVLYCLCKRIVQSPPGHTISSSTVSRFHFPAREEV